MTPVRFVALQLQRTVQLQGELGRLDPVLAPAVLKTHLDVGAGGELDAHPPPSRRSLRRDPLDPQSCRPAPAGQRQCLHLRRRSRVEPQPAQHLKPPQRGHV